MIFYLLAWWSGGFGLAHVWHQAYEPRPLESQDARTLMFGTVAATLSAKEFALLRTQFNQARDVLEVDLGDFFPTEAALGLLLKTVLFLPLLCLSFTLHESSHSFLSSINVEKRDRSHQFFFSPKG